MTVKIGAKTGEVVYMAAALVYILGLRTYRWLAEKQKPGSKKPENKKAGTKTWKQKPTFRPHASARSSGYYWQ